MSLSPTPSTQNPSSSQSEEMAGMKRQLTDVLTTLSEFQQEQRARTEANQEVIGAHSNILKDIQSTLTQLQTPSSTPVVTRPRASVSQQDVPVPDRSLNLLPTPSTGGNDAFRRLTQRELTHETGIFISLDPLAKKLTDKPVIAENLLIGAKGDSDNARDLQTWQVGPYDSDRASFEITQIEEKGRWIPPSGTRPKARLTLVELKSSCALSYEKAKELFGVILPTLTLENVMPYPTRATAIRLIWRDSAKKHAYKIMDQNQNTIEHLEVSTSPGGGGDRGRDEAKDTSATGHNKNCQLSEQALAHMKTSNAHLRDLTGTLVLQSLLYRLSQAEKDDSMCKIYWCLSRYCSTCAGMVLEMFVRLENCF